MSQAEMDVVEHMLASLTTCALQTRVAPSNEQVAHHFELACKRVGFLVTPASAIRIFKRLAHEVQKASRFWNSSVLIPVSCNEQPIELM